MTVDLKNWETFINTGNPVVGASVVVRAASDLIPNPNGVVASTTTDGNGMWAVTGLADGYYDIDVTYNGVTKHYKGNGKVPLLVQPYQHGSQNANRVLAGPTTGADAYPTWRSLVLGDLPSGVNTLAYSALVNGGWEIAQRYTSKSGLASNDFLADRWQFTKGGTSTCDYTKTGVGLADTTCDTASRFAGKLAYTHNTASQVWQKLEDPYQLRGLTLTFTARVKTSTGSAVRLRIDDSAGSGTAGSYHSGGGGWETLTATKVIDAGATTVHLRLLLEASATVYVDNCALGIGVPAPVYVPLAPDDDLARCQRYYQVIARGTGVPIAVGQCTGPTQATYIRALSVEMGGSPSLLFSTQTHFASTKADGTLVASDGLTSGMVSGREFVITTTCLAGGLVAGNASRLVSNNASAEMSLEWNP